MLRWANLTLSLIFEKPIHIRFLYLHTKFYKYCSMENLNFYIDGHESKPTISILAFVEKS